MKKTFENQLTQPGCAIYVKIASLSLIVFFVFIETDRIASIEILFLTKNENLSNYCDFQFETAVRHQSASIILIWLGSCEIFCLTLRPTQTATMYQTYHLMKNFELQKKKYFGNNVLRKPIRLGCFAVTSHGAERHSLNDNPESCYYKYSLDKEKLSNEHLDLKVACEEKLEKEEDVLKLNGELDVFLGQILKNKDKYLLNQAGSSQASGPPTNQGSESLDNLMGGMRLNSGDAESDAKLLATDFVALRATLAILL